MIAAQAVAAVSPAAVSAPHLPYTTDRVLVLTFRGRGDQNYICAQTGPDSYGWSLVGPKAVLVDALGRTVGRHYAGPTWELADGSTIRGRVVAKAPSPAGVDWLSLDAAPGSAMGAFGGIVTIRREDTSGGLPPAGGCTAATAGRTVASPYSATYRFYRGQR